MAAHGSENTRNIPEGKIPADELHQIDIQYLFAKTEFIVEGPVE
jgi:hypothetical protein